jgi:hypothetical protein
MKNILVNMLTFALFWIDEFSIISLSLGICLDFTSCPKHNYKHLPKIEVILFHLSLECQSSEEKARDPNNYM